MIPDPSSHLETPSARSLKPKMQLTYSASQHGPGSAWHSPQEAAGQYPEALASLDEATERASLDPVPWAIRIRVLNKMAAAGLADAKGEGDLFIEAVERYTALAPGGEADSIP